MEQSPNEQTIVAASHRRIFYHLLANTLAVSIINFTVFFAITFFIYLETRSVFATGIIAGIFLGLTALSGIWFGSIVDHQQKRTAMLLSTLASLGLYVVCLVIYGVSGEGSFQDPTSPVLWVFVVLLVTGVIIGNIRGIAMTTVVTLLFPDGERDKANGLVGTATGVTFLVTSVISGILVGLAGMLYVLILAVAVLGISVAHLLLVRVPEDRPATSSSDPNDNKVDIRGTLAVVGAVPGLFALIGFGAINNLLGGVFMALIDAYGLSLVSVEVWGLIWGLLSSGFIVGGLIITKRGLGRNPLRSLMLANMAIWTVSCFYTLRSSIILFTIGMYIYLCLVPFIEAAEQTVMQRVVPYERQGRVFGFAQSVEQSASPLTAFFISPIAQFIFIPFMTTGAGVELIGGWFGTGADRGLALLFTLAGIIGLILTIVAMRSSYYRLLSDRYLEGVTAAPSDGVAPSEMA